MIKEILSKLYQYQHPVNCFLRNGRRLLCQVKHVNKYFMVVDSQSDKDVVILLKDVSMVMTVNGK